MDKQAAFNEIISDYAEARPGYPIELYHDIIRFSGIEPGAKLLEVGPGPGQATDYFVKNGYRVTGLEIGNDQVRYLTEKYRQYPNFRAVRSAFEDFDSPDDACDLIYSATAFHWIAPETGYPKAYRLLRKHGTLAVFWHLSSIVERKTEEFAAIREIYRKIAPELDTYINDEEAENMHRLRISQIQTEHLFGEPDCRVYRWNDEYTADRFLRLEKTYSDFYMISESKQIAVLNGISDYLKTKNDRISIPQEVRLYMVRK